MKITNKYGLPQPLVEAVSNDPYDKGDSDISITRLIGPTRIGALEIKHGSELSEDVSDRIWPLLGQSVHGILERANKDGIAERRLTTEIAGWKVSGAIDRYLPSVGLIQDWKVVSVWSIKDGVKEEYEQQLNCYAELIRRNGEAVKKMELVAILRDWSKMQVEKDSNYPPHQVVLLDVPLWTQEKAAAFLESRVKAHQAARISLPECTEAERWAKPTKWAVMVPTQDRAKRLLDSKNEAEVLAAKTKGSYVEKRQGSNQRCEFYCPVSQWCEQFKKLKGE